MISGYFDPTILPQPVLTVAVRIAAVHPEFQLVNFIVDTGAAITCIHAVDAMRLFGMSPAGLDPRLGSPSVDRRHRGWFELYGDARRLRVPTR